jgi:uncharacterized protein DUF4340
MLTRFHKILIAILAIQLVLVVIVLTRSNEDVVLKEHPVVAGFDAAKVTRLQIFAAHDAPIDLVKRDAGWVMASGFDYPVDAARITDALGPIGKASGAAPIATQAARHKQLHVAEGEFERKLVMTMNGKDVTLYIGTPAGARRTAVRIGGSDDVFGVAGLSAGTFSSEPRAWVDPSYVKISRADISKIVIEREGGPTVALVAPAAPAAAAGSGSAGSAAGSAAPAPAIGPWSATIGGAPITLAAGESLDSPMIDRMIGDATTIELSAPADAKRAPAKPIATITIERKTGAPTVIDVVADGARYWVHDRSSPRAVVVDKGRLESVVDAARDKLVTKPAPPATQSAKPPGPSGASRPGMPPPPTAGSAAGPG